MELSIAKKALAKALKEGKPKAVSAKTDFLNNLKNDIIALIEKGFSANQIYNILKESGFLGSYQTVRAVVAEWKEEMGLSKPKTAKAEKEAASAAPGTDAAANAAGEKKPSAKPAKAETAGEKQAAYDEKLSI